MSTLLLCDDHRVVREALADLLATIPGVSAVTQAGSAQEVLAAYPAQRPAAVACRLAAGGGPDRRARIVLSARKGRRHPCEPFRSTRYTVRP